MRELDCLRCGGRMSFVMREKFQLGQTGWILGGWPNLMAGAMELEVYACPGCGKTEFFTPEGPDPDGELPQKRCPRCHVMIDFDYPRCPVCKYDFNAG